VGGRASVSSSRTRWGECPHEPSAQPYTNRPTTVGRDSVEPSWRDDSFVSVTLRFVTAPPQPLNIARQ